MNDNILLLALLTTVGTNPCRIYSHSFLGDYSFLNLKIVENLNAANLNFLHNKLNFCCKNYSRAEIIRRNTIPRIQILNGFLFL